MRGKMDAGMRLGHLREKMLSLVLTSPLLEFKTCCRNLSPTSHVVAAERNFMHRGRSFRKFNTLPLCFIPIERMTVKFPALAPVLPRFMPDSHLQSSYTVCHRCRSCDI